METLRNDLRMALRVLFKRPQMTVAAAICLALGIGATTVVYSLVDGVLLRPLPYRNPDQLFVLWNQFPGQGIPKTLVSGQELLDLDEQATSFESIVGMIPWYFNLTQGEDPERLVGARVSPETFQTLGASAAQGRVFGPEEARQGASVVILSHALWQRRFQGDPGVVGQSVSLDEQPYTVIGVMPESFRYLLGNTDIWVPLVVNPRVPRHLRGVQVVGRLAPGTTRERAQAELDTIAERFVSSHPNAYPEGSGYGMTLSPLFEEIVGGVRTTLLALLAAVTLVLVIACTNVANLLLAQATTREREIAVRAALGASGWRLVRQLLTESVLLAVVGGVFGVIASHLGLSAIKSMQAANMPRLHGIQIDLRILLFALGLSVATGLLFGLVPALRGLRLDLFSTLKEGGRTSADSKSHPLRHGLVVGQVALALVVLIGAGLMIRTFSKLQQIDPGFQTEGVLTAQIYLSPRRYSQPHQQAAFVENLERRLREIPGVRQAGFVSHIPLGPLDLQSEIEVENRPASPGVANPKVGIRFASPGYFEAMKIPLLSGRPISDLDHAEGASVAVIDAALAKRLWPDDSPLDRRVRVIGGFTEDPWRTIVGVVGSVRHAGLAAPTSEQVYIPMAQSPSLVAGLVVTTAGDPLALVPPVRAAVRAIDPAQPLARVKTASDLVGEALTQPRFNRLLFGLFGGAALILAAIGVYGVMAYAVVQRRRELGLRMALGARPTDNLRLVLKQGLRLALLGTVVGVFGAFVATRLLAPHLAALTRGGVGATDGWTFVVVPLVLLALALVACLTPAVRATRVDPVISLRQD